MRKIGLVLLCLVLVGGTALGQSSKKTKPKAKAEVHVPGLAELQRMTARFAKTEYVVDTSKLSPNDKKALAKLVEAARVIDDIFMSQYWSGDHELYARLKLDKTPLGEQRFAYFWINKGPWSALDANKSFLPPVMEGGKEGEWTPDGGMKPTVMFKPLRIPAEKLPGANFYPEDMTKQEFESWVKTLPAEQQKEATGFFTVIRRDGDKKLTMVPYSEEYKVNLEKCGKLLREAAALTDNTTLKDFLTKRAQAFETNDYYESDLAWMDLDAPIDVTIGPYETYNDEIFGYKAAYEAYVNLRDDAETKKVAEFSRVLQDIENNLPIDPSLRNPKLAAAAPIRVVNEVFGAGDGNHGVQTAAYNLPNDERVITQKGAKRVMLKNVQEAKFRKTLVPITKVVLAKDEQKDLSFDWFFTHILFHELAHGLGPHQITVNGQKTTPRAQLKELYSPIEEAKADALGLYGLQYMIDHEKELGLEGVLPKGPDAEQKLYATFLASSFRSLRFGLHEAHGKGMALQVNYLIDKGGFVAKPDGTFAVDYDKIKDAVRDLTHDLLMVEANGDYDGAKKMLDLAILRPPFQKAIDRLKLVPVDIRPIFVTADRITHPPVKKTKK